LKDYCEISKIEASSLKVERKVLDIDTNLIEKFDLLNSQPTENIDKNLLLLALSQIFSFTAAPVTVFLSGIIGSQISPVKSLSTLPMSISVVGIAIGAIVATKVMSLVGRKYGFILASIGNALISILAAYSVLNQNFVL